MKLKSEAHYSELDAYIGAKLKQRRSELGMSQGKLGERLGVTFQQVQKYENGKNRISAGALYRISKVLGVEFSYFVDGFEQSNTLKDGSTVVYNTRSRETANLVNHFSNISEPSVKKRILGLVKAVSALNK